MHIKKETFKYKRLPKRSEWESCQKLYGIHIKYYAGNFTIDAMRILRKTHLIGSLIFTYALFSYSCSSKKQDELVDLYSSSGENNYYRYKDTIEVRPTDDGKFDIQSLAMWSPPEVVRQDKKAGGMG